MRGEKGVALLTVMLLLFLMTGFSLFVFQNAMIEKQISAYSRKEAISLALAESGIDQVVAWFAVPESSPDPSFFKKRFCERSESEPGFSTTLSWMNDHLVSFSDEGVGRVDLSIYASLSSFPPNGRCHVKAVVNRGRVVEVDLARAPIPPITTPTYGASVDSLLQIITHWGPTHSKNGIDLAPTDMNRLHRFVKRFGRALVLSSSGLLEEQGQVLGRFDQVFGLSDAGLVFIDAEKFGPLQIELGNYKGYFYVLGDIDIVGSGLGRSVLAMAPPPPDFPRSEMVDGIHLDGFLYTPGWITVTSFFGVYGAIYAGSGLMGPGPLVVWYNDSFRLGQYEGVVPLIRMPGTWKTM
jgi:hypothetical protein